MSDGTPIQIVLDQLTGIIPSGDSGKQWAACCPVHGDQHQSLGVAEGRDGRVLLRCYAGCSVKDILAAIGLEFRDLFPDRIEKPQPAGVSVGSLAFDKRISKEFLRDICRLTDEVGTGKNGGRRVLIPYFDADGSELYTRFRSALKASEGSSYRKGTDPRAYGLWRLPQYRAGNSPARVLIITEGESDAWTLWLHNYPAIGVPGADATNSVRAADIAEFDTIYIWQDDDGAGAKFVVRMAARIAELVATVPGGRMPTVLVLSSGEAKDPNRLLQMFGPGDPFRARFDACLAAAKPPVLTEEALEETKEYDLSDMGNAQRLVASHGTDLRYAEELGQWYVWSGSRWRSRLIGPVMQRAKSTVRAIPKEIVGVTDPKRLTAILQHAGRSQSRRAVSDMVKLAESESTIAIEPSDIDADRFLLNVLNGTINLRTGELKPHRRGDLITKLCPVVYDPNAKSARWKLIAARIFAGDANDPEDRGDAEVIQFLKRLLGYSLTGDVTEQILPIFWGGGSNGKSTILNVIRELMGRGYAAKAPRGLLMAKHNESHPTELTVMFGARLVIATESKRGQRLSEELVKDLTGGEAITARYMKKDFFEFEATHKLILCTNHKPRIPESDDGIWRRMIPVAFKTKFWNPSKGEMGPEHLRRDNNLATTLRDEFPGILAWLIRGCIEWQKGGLNAPVSIQDEAIAYRQEEDKTAQYLADCCEISNAAGNTLLKTVFADYCKWCEEAGYRHLARNDFASDLRSKNVVIRNGSHNAATCYGLKLVSANHSRGTVSDLSDLDE